MKRFRSAPFRGWRLRLWPAAAIALALVPAAAASAADAPGPGALPTAEPGPPDYDSRQAAPPAPVSRSRREALSRLRRDLGPRGLVRLDPLTATPRLVGKSAGFLTAGSSSDPAVVAERYVARNPGPFGLDRDDLEGLRVGRRYRSESGMTHLRFVQAYAGIPAIGTALTANVTDDGELVNVGGAPRPDLQTSDVEPRLSPGDALRSAMRDVGTGGTVRQAGTSRGRERETHFASGDRASLVLFPDRRDRVRLAWRVLLFADDGHVYDSAVDADSGELLRRHDLLHDASGEVFRNYPGAAVGGSQSSQAFSTSGDDRWLSAYTRLEGNNAVVYSDANNSVYSSIGPGGEPSPGPAVGDLVPPDSGSGTPTAAWTSLQSTQGVSGIPGRSCPAAGCSWNGFDGSFSWTVNRKQAGTQLFYFVNLFHDHLRDAAGIGFDEVSGNFEESNSSGTGAGSDPVHAQTNDGANILSGFPDCAHTSNANMATLPDGLSPRMQMYLFSSKCGAGWGHDVNSSDDPFVVYHEYGHGLSGRLITGPGGYEELDGDQAGAMGEAWSDWYAMDYLVADGLETDTAAHGNLPNTPYEGTAFRTQPLDCPGGSAAAACGGTSGAGSGGYTYGDFGEVVGGPQVHADGEIWAETLWDLRRAMLAAHPADGVFRTRALVTDGMRLSPDDPSFLDMRDAILQANTARGFGDRALILEVFRARGMGWCASTSGSYDTSPDEDFSPEGAACPALLGGSAPAPSPSPAPTPAPAPAPAPAPTTTPSPQIPAAPAAPRVTAGTLRVDRRGRFRYAFRGSAGARATVTVATARRRLVRLSVVVPRTGRASPLLRLSRRDRRMLRARRRLAAKATVTITAGPDRGGSASARVTLRPARPRPPR